jgi:hypothetical protein
MLKKETKNNIRQPRYKSSHQEKGKLKKQIIIKNTRSHIQSPENTKKLTRMGSKL